MEDENTRMWLFTKYLNNLKSTNWLSTKDASVTVINVHDTNDDENDKKTERGKLN